MKLLRLILALWLSVAVPTAALATVTSEAHCNRMAPVVAASNADVPAGDDMKGMTHEQHLQHMAVASDTKAPTHGCQCGCNCSNQHCVSVFSVLMTGLVVVANLTIEDGGLHAYVGPSRTASAHHLDLLRPPSLT